MKRRLRTGIVAVGLGAVLVAGAATAHGATEDRAPAESASRAGTDALDRQALQRSLDALHEAGMYGAYAAVRDGDDHWRGATGVADVDTGRPMRPDMPHRVGSITKTFTTVALLQLVEQGRVDLDSPIGEYLPELVPGERGQAVTVRMLLNHTSGIGDYLPGAFPSLNEGSVDSLAEERFRTLTPKELIGFGLQAPPTGEPGEQHAYSNTNFVILGELLEKVTGTPAEKYITREVIRPAGLRHTYFPRSPFLPKPHAKMYESFYGLFDPPRDFSTYNMSWGGTAGAVVSTMDDLTRFYRALLGGDLLSAEQLAEMQRTVPTPEGGAYGLGLYPVNLPCGQAWGHDGAVWGAGTLAFSSPDGERQAAVGLNLMKYQTVSEDGLPQPHPIDEALVLHLVEALCPASEAKVDTLSEDTVRQVLEQLPRYADAPLARP